MILVGAKTVKEHKIPEISQEKPKYFTCFEIYLHP